MIRLISVDVSRNGIDSAFIRVVNVFNKMGREVEKKTEEDNEIKLRVNKGGVTMKVGHFKRRAFQTKEQYDKYISSLHEELKKEHGKEVNIYPSFGEK